MKSSIITLLLITILNIGFSQNLKFEIHGAYSRPVKKEQLAEAKLIRDFTPGYPAAWITKYISVELSASIIGNTVTASNTNDIITSEQKNILNSMDIGNDIEVNINYNYNNPATDKVELNKIHFSFTVIPEVQAEFPGGANQMKKYLAVNTINKVPDLSLYGERTYSKVLEQGKVRFTIDEKGGVQDAHLTKSCGNATIDKLLLDVVNKMPPWSPAQNVKGTNVKQDFELVVGNDGC